MRISGLTEIPSCPRGFSSAKSIPLTGPTLVAIYPNVWSSVLTPLGTLPLQPPWSHILSQQFDSVLRLSSTQFNSEPGVYLYGSITSSSLMGFTVQPPQLFSLHPNQSSAQAFRKASLNFWNFPLMTFWSFSVLYICLYRHKYGVI